MNKKIKSRFLIIAAMVLLAGTVAVYLMWNKPHKNVEDASAIEINAAELYALFVTDSIKANTLYVDKIVKVSGKLERFSTNQQNQQIVLIKTAVDGGYINCTMEQQAADLKPGDGILIKGICSGYIPGEADMGLPGDVFLIRGYSIKK